MKRIHLFEFEDLPWFPSMLRACMTRYLNTIHKLLETDKDITEKLSEMITLSGEKQIVDLCSGSGGPMPNVLLKLQNQESFEDVQMTLSDLHPNTENVSQINSSKISSLSYLEKPIDATQIGTEVDGIRTMICGFHHMTPDAASEILLNTQTTKKPILIYEISDNSFPKWLWWLVIPFNIIGTFFITPMVRPMSWQQLVFTYLIPILPILIAWDGAVSNARTYTLDDLDILLKKLPTTENYSWEKGIIKTKSKKLFLLGLPKKV